MPKNKEFEKFARLIKEEGEDIRTDVRDQISGLRNEVGDQISGLREEMHEGFAAINRRLEQIIQMQLDEHAARIKKLEAAVFSKQFLGLAYNLAADTIRFAAPRLSRIRDVPSHPLPLGG
jgi:hypothetical protein